MKRTLTITAVAAVLFVGCGTPSNFYQLNVAQSSSHTTQTLPKRVIGIAEVEVADYLDQPQVVTRISDEMLRINETERWAGPFDKNVQEALRKSLARRMSHYAFVTKPYGEPLDERYRIYVRIDRFDGDVNGTVRLEGRWSLVRLEDQKTLVSQEIYETTRTEPTFRHIVAAQSRMVERMAKRMAETMRRYL